MTQQTQPAPRRRSVLSIAGSDSGGGAGIQADLRTIVAHGLHPLTAVTALTAQHTRGVTAIHPCPLDVLEAQIKAAFDDFDVAAVKVGMLANGALIDRVADVLTSVGPVPIVLDPVMVASSGAVLLEPAAVRRLIDRMFPLARVITPNLPEAELVNGIRVGSADVLAGAAAALRALGCPAVLLKGGHLPGDTAVDWLDDGGATWAFRHARLGIEGHGTGCTLSSAIACGLALGHPLQLACGEACDYVHGALRHAYRPGQSDLCVLDHHWRQTLH